MNMISFLFLITLSMVSQASAQEVQFDAPDRYNRLIWDGSDKSWFEWWYVKVVIPEQNESFYMTYGVVNPWDKTGKSNNALSFVSFGDFSQKRIDEEQLSVSDFTASKDEVLVRIGDNLLTDKHVRGKSKNSSFDFTITRKWSFNAMGWGMFIKGLTNIGWFPAQADARCTGEIITNGVPVRFENAPCYQDRNWGGEFPKWWAWIVSNQFKEDPTAALVAGGGRPKVLGREFYENVILGFNYKGKQYSYRPNDLNSVKSKICFGKWEVIAENKETRLELEATAPKESFMDLPFLTPQGEIFHDMETLSGKMTVRFYEKTLVGLNLVTTLTTDFAGLEYGSVNPVPCF